MAIPLTDPSSGSKRRMASLPYEKGANLRRNKSVPDFEAEPIAPTNLFGQVPQIVVTRGPTGSDGDFPSYPRDEELFGKKQRKSRKSESDANVSDLKFKTWQTLGYAVKHDKTLVVITFQVFLPIKQMLMFTISLRVYRMLIVKTYFRLSWRKSPLYIRLQLVV